MAFSFSKLTLLRRFVSVSVNEKLVEGLQPLITKLKINNINELLQTTPELNNYSPEQWKRTHDFLKGEGFNTNSFAYMISQNPKLIKTPEIHICESINTWKSFQFGERNTIKLLEKFPELLNIQQSKEFTKTFNTIKSFVGGGQNIYKLLMSSPSILFESLPDIDEKIDYISNVMKVEVSQVYKSTVMSLDIVTLKTRHVFLERLGLFIAKKVKDKDEVKSNDKNPKLFRIADTDDKTFATKVCSVTLEEFETFQELYKKELDQEIDDESSDEESYETGHDASVKIEFEVI